MLNFFKKTKNIGPSVEDRLLLLETTLSEERAAKEKVEKELFVAREQIKEHEEKKNGLDPWVEVVGESVDPVRGIEIRLDWNEAFIQYLKENGITGKDEDAAVQKWLAFLYQNLIEKLEQQVIDNSDKKTISDFV